VGSSYGWARPASLFISGLISVTSNLFFLVIGYFYIISKGLSASLCSEAKGFYQHMVVVKDNIPH
jgi:hypothetical protein